MKNIRTKMNLKGSLKLLNKKDLEGIHTSTLEIL